MKSWSLQTACALSRDKFVAVRYFGEDDDEDFETQEVVFNAGHHPPRTIARQGENVRIARVTSTGDMTALLARDGRVEFLSFTGESLGHEDITGAITSGRRVPRFGFLLSIACIGDRLYACGMGGQVYARVAEGKWTLISPSLCTTAQYTRWFSNIQGLDANHIFAAGISIVADRSSGVLFFYDGTAWKQVATDAGTAIGEMVFLGAETIYIAGGRSTLLVGNVREGFHPIRVSARDLELYTICRYRGDIFIGTGEGLFRLQRSREGLLRVDGDIGARDIVSLQVVDDVMWCFGAKLVRRYDGERWEPFDHVF